MQEEQTMNLEFHELESGIPLREVLDFSYGLTVERNNAYLPTYESRVAHLLLGGGEMLDTVRRIENDMNPENINLLSILASKIVLRIFTVMQNIEEGRLFVGELIKKYPEGGCSYCGQKPCICEVARSATIFGARSSEAQKTWTIQDWQNHLKDVYGPNNTLRGMYFVAGRLMGETTEVLDESILVGKSEGEEKTKHKVAVINELTDCFAQLIGICNVAGIDLEEAFVKRYGKGCPKCGNYPCTCGPFSHVPERKDENNLAKI